MSAIENATARKTYEAWLNRQPTEDLRAMLTDDELSVEDRELIAALVELRKTQPRTDLTDIDFAKPLTCGCWNYVNLGHCIHTV